MIRSCVRGAALTVGSAWLQQLQSHTHTHRRKVWVNRTPPPIQGEQDQPSAVGHSAGPGLTHSHTTHIHTHAHTSHSAPLSSILYSLPYHFPPTSVYTCPLPFTTHLPCSLSLPRFAIPYSALNHREHQSWMSVLSRWTLEIFTPPGHIKASWEFPAGGW